MPTLDEEGRVVIDPGMGKVTEPTTTDSIDLDLVETIAVETEYASTITEVVSEVRKLRELLRTTEAERDTAKGHIKGWIERETRLSTEHMEELAQLQEQVERLAQDCLAYMTALEQIRDYRNEDRYRDARSEHDMFYLANTIIENMKELARAVLPVSEATTND